MYRNSNRRILHALTAVLIMAGFFCISVFALIHEAEHECTGEECPVCQVIALAEQGLSPKIRNIPAGMILPAVFHTCSAQICFAAVCVIVAARLPLYRIRFNN